MSIGRRGLLKAIGIGAAAPALAPAMATQSAGYGVIGMMGAGVGQDPGVPGVASSGMVRYASLAEFMLKTADAQAREHSKYVTSIDADIACMHVPLNTKVIWQRERNYKRRLKEQENWFMRQFKKHGFVETWE